MGHSHSKDGYRHGESNQDPDSLVLASRHESIYLDPEFMIPDDATSSTTPSETSSLQEEEVTARESGSLMPAEPLIGWVAKLRERNGAPDASEEFKKVLDEIVGGKHKIARRWDVSFLVVPGLFCDKWPAGYMTKTLQHLQDLGLDSRLSKIDCGNGIVLNAEHLAKEVEDSFEFKGKRIVLVGHSKGAVDAVAAVERFSERLVGKVAGIVSLQGPLGGAMIADGLLGNSKVVRGATIKVVRHMLHASKDAVKDLTHGRRKQDIEKFQYPYEKVPILTFSSCTTSYSSPLAPLAKMFASKGGGHGTDGMVFTEDADLPESLRVFFDEDWDHAGCAFGRPNAPYTDRQVNEAAITVLLSRIPVECMKA